MVTAANPPVVDEDGVGKINPLAGMGLSDEAYANILQGIVNGENFQGLNPNFNLIGMGATGVSVGMSGVQLGGAMEKRRMEMEMEEERDGKRGRFEVIE